MSPELGNSHFKVLRFYILYFYSYKVSDEQRERNSKVQGD